MKKFLTSFTSVLAGFAATQADATMVPNADATPMSYQRDQLASTSVGSAVEQQLSVRGSSGDAFSFVLKRAPETGLVMAYHRSHSSHASHASHASHYSSRY